MQQCSGVPYWRRDKDHIEKAFDFGGMGARNGVLAAIMVQEGWTAVDGVLTGKPSYLSAFAEQAVPAAFTDELGARYEIMGASIKKWCVGSPIQAALDALLTLMTAHNISPSDVARLDATMPDDRLHIVDDRDMPDVCLQHLLAILLLDGTVGFDAAHDKARMSEPKVLALRKIIFCHGSKALTDAMPPRQAIIEITTTKGIRLRHHTRAVLGTPANPMDEDQVAAKALDLMAPVLSRDQAQKLVQRVLSIGTLDDVRDLRPLLQAQV